MNGIGRNCLTKKENPITNGSGKQQSNSVKNTPGIGKNTGIKMDLSNAEKY